MKYSGLSANVEKQIESEEKDFVIETKRIHPPQVITSLLIVFSSSSFLALHFLYRLNQNWEFLLKKKDLISVELVGGVIAMLIFFSVLSFVKIVREVMTIRKGYFIGTPKVLLYCAGKTLKFFLWKDFSGHIEIERKGEKNNIKLQMKTGRMGKRGYVPDIVYIFGVPRDSQIPEICRKRIEENKKDTSPVFSH